VRRKVIYSSELNESVHRKIPGLINDAMQRLGWNAFGIYETVRDEINRDMKKKLAKAKA
jgi:hypothetical protein